MTDNNNNPWASQTGTSTSHQGGTYLPPSGPPPGTGLNQHPPSPHTQGPTPSSNPYTQTQTQPAPSTPSTTVDYQTQGPPVPGGFSGGYGEPVPPRRTGTLSEGALPRDADRSHQMEVMQSYEMSREWTEDEQNQAILQREFPNIDSSLIAAIYGDSGSLSATREMLQELNS